MNNIIKCPVCHEMAGLRYNENRVYQSRCQNMSCRETVTVTAPSGKAAEELFSKFEKGTNHSKLSIPKKIADSIVKLAKYHQKAAAVNGDIFGILDATEWLMNFMIAGRENIMNPELFDYLNQDKSGHIETCIAFMNPLTRPFVEVIDE